MVALVTGGSKGIGLAIARALLDRDMQVAISGRHEADLRRAAEQLGAGANLVTVSADVRDEADARRSVEETVRAFGGLDVLVNNAGVGKFANVADMTPEMFRDVIDTNLTGVFYCTRAVLPHVKSAGGGWIINIASLAARNYFPGGGAYCASKAALVAFSESLMQEVRVDNIRVSVVMPGSVATEFSGPHGRHEDDSWKLTPDDVAQTVMDLLRHPGRSLPSKIEIRPAKTR